MTEAALAEALAEATFELGGADDFAADDAVGGVGAGALDEGENGDGMGDGSDDVADVPHAFPEPDAARVPAARLTPEERTARLFADMFPLKQDFLAVLSFCEQSRPFAEISRLIDGLRQSRRSVYTADNYLNMLVGAGALELLGEDGAPYVERATEPVEVERDGVTYLQVATPPEPFWHTTPAGCAAVREHDVRDELDRLFAGHAAFLDAFAVMLDLCAREEGATIAELKEAVNGRPEMVEAKKTAQFLLDYLTDAGAVRYDGAWKLTDTGARALDALAAHKE